MKHPQQFVLSLWLEDTSRNIWVWLNETKTWRLSYIWEVLACPDLHYAIGTKPVNPPLVKSLSPIDKIADNERELGLDYETEQAQNKEPVAYIKDRELGYMLAVREVGAKEWRTNLGLYPEAGDVPLYTAPPPSFQEIEELNELYMAAKNVIAWTEATHRPPVCDALETGRMVKVRLHALADLQDAIEAVREKNNVR